jgi:glycosyltransferase involved in cell wall biosynthesis
MLFWKAGYKMHANGATGGGVGRGRFSSKSRTSNSSGRRLRVFVATPLGVAGRGGIDRLNDSIFDVISIKGNLELSVTRIVTRGQAGLFAAQFVFAAALFKLCAAALFRKIDLLHIHLSINGSSYRKAVLGFAASVLGIPYVVHLHGCNFDDFWSTTSPWLARSIDSLFRNSVRIVALGQYWADSIAQRLPDVADKVVVLPNASWPCSQPQIPSGNGRTRITFLGQLGARKGTPQFVQALAMLRDEDNWEATIAGDGEIPETLGLVESLGLAQRVSIPGWLSGAATEALLNRTDILALPSFSENLPMVILEAFAHGVPVVSTPVGAIPEVVQDQRNGLIVDVGDVNGLAEALRRLVNDPGFRRALGDNALRDHQDKYEIEKYVMQLAALWVEAAGRSPDRATDVQCARP